MATDHARSAGRDVLPVPDVPPPGLITYDAEDYPSPNAFTGEVRWVEIDVDDAAVDADHRLDPDELLRVAMARQ